MNLPKIEQAGNIYRLTWAEEGVAAEVRRLADRNYGPGGEITWVSLAPGQEGILHQGYLGLTSTTGKRSLMQALAERQSGKNWKSIVEQLAILVLRSFREGAEASLIRTGYGAVTRTPVAIAPLVFEKHPYVLFGAPASAKSYLALILAAIAADEQIQVPPFRCYSKKRVLVLDWESSEADLAFRLARLQAGFGKTLDELITYRPCSMPLSYDIERVQNVVLNYGIDFIIIDSLGPAAGGDLNAAQSAQQFFSALRSLECTSVILAHTAKSHEAKRRTIYGSMFFNALARGASEVKSFESPGDDTLSIGIYPRKSNFSRLERPIGLTLRFDGDEGPVTVTREDLRQVPDLSQRLPVRERILDALCHAPHPLAQGELRERLDDVAANTITKTLSRMMDAKVVIQVDGRYAAAVEEDLAAF